MITIQGGSLTTYNIEIANYAGSTGRLNLYGGTLKTTRPSADQLLIGMDGIVDLRGTGTFILTGNQKGYIQDRMMLGRIISTDGRGSINVDYDSNQNITVVSVISTPLPKCEELISAGLITAADLNRDCYVDYEDLVLFSEYWLIDTLD